MADSRTASFAGDPAFVYNNADELTAADHQAVGLTDESYALDVAGNRQTVGGVTWTTAAYNRLTSDGTYSYTYDAEGNLKTRAKTGEHVTYDWDHRNRLIGVSDRTAAGAAFPIARDSPQSKHRKRRSELV